MFTVLELAAYINEDCRAGKYFWASGLVRETVDVWRDPENYAYLCREAKVMADHYLAGKETK